MSLTQRRRGAKKDACDGEPISPATFQSMHSSLFAPLRLCVRPLTASHARSLAFLGAALLWLSLPPVDWWPLAWVAPVPWVLLIRRKELDGRRPYAMLTLAGFCFWMAALHWLRLPHPATSLGWFALSFYFAFYLPAFIALSRVAVHRLGISVVLAAPIVWTGLELARAHLLTGMTMASLGHTQYRWIELIQLSDLAGAFGVSFVVMFVAASLARMLPVRESGTDPICTQHPTVPAGKSGLSFLSSLWPLAAAAAVLAAALVYGHVRMAANTPKAGPRIALVQGSIDIEFLDSQSARENLKNRIFDQYYKLSQDAVAQDKHLDLLVWPETMFTRPLVTYDRDFTLPPDFDGTPDDVRSSAENGLSWLSHVARSLDVPLLLGVDAYHFGRNGEQCFNSAAYVARDGRLLGRYDKMHLVMFGEYVPFAEYIPWLYGLTPLTGGATPGQRPAAFDVGGVRIAPDICYETVLSHVIRGQINRLTDEGHEPDVLVNLTNDGWFWGSSELDMHLVCGVFRAVECRKPLVIAANTGFSAWIDGDGRIRQQGPRRATGIIVAETELDGRHSWYLVHGDWFAGICLVACGLFGLVGILRRRKRTVTTV